MKIQVWAEPIFSILHGGEVYGGASFRDNAVSFCGPSVRERPEFLHY